MPPPAALQRCSQKGVACARATQELRQQRARATEQELGQQCGGAGREAARAPQVERRGVAEAARKSAPSRRGATSSTSGSPSTSTRASKSKRSPRRRRRRHRSSSSTARPPPRTLVRVAYDGGEAELPAPAYFGALRAATAAARLDALERTARRAERALRDAPDDDEAVRPPAVERTDDATDAALARAFAAAQTGQGPKRKKRKTRAEKRAPAKDAGPGWYGLPRADATVSADDRAALALRGVADPKRHYKRQDAPSEFAALGTVVAGKFRRRLGNFQETRERKTGLMGEPRRRRRALLREATIYRRARKAARAGPVDAETEAALALHGGKKGR